MTSPCNHDTPFHMRLLVDAAHGRLRHCPNCRANAYGPPFSDFGPPADDFMEAWRKRPENRTPSLGADRVGTNWDRPRMVPWLPWDHPNFYVTSQREAIRVCKEWGIDPERGFISKKHEARAFAAARANRAAALDKWTPQERAQRAAARGRANGRPVAPVNRGHQDRHFVSFSQKRGD